MKTYDEHIEWCKVAAREYLERGDARNAVASMLSDLQKHEETRMIGANLTPLGMLATRSIKEARRFIEGFR